MENSKQKLIDYKGILDSILPPISSTDPISILESKIMETLVTQSVSHDDLKKFHRYKFDPKSIPCNRDDILSDTPFRPLHKNLVLTELLMAVGKFDTAIALGEQLFANFPSDHRVQDALCRARYYLRIGKVDEHPGLELRGNVCPVLWNTLGLTPDGSAYLCCSVWLRTPVGNVFSQSPQEIWRSKFAEKVRESALNGDYKFCGKLACPLIQEVLFPLNNDSSHRFIDPTQVPAQLLPPKHLNLSYDMTCNLSCPSCRDTKIVAKGKELTRIEKITDHVLDMLPDAARIDVTGSGDPFASKSFRRLLTSINPVELPTLKITIMTNGLLLRRSDWGLFEHLHGTIDAVFVSVDAARPDTYSIVRRGGEFKDLLPNLYFIGELARQGEIRHYRLCFVVQDHNFREMHEFIELAKKVGAYQVHFQMMHDWGTYSKLELNKRRVHLPSHPHYEEFLELVKSLPSSEELEILSDFLYLQ